MAKENLVDSFYTLGLDTVGCSLGAHGDAQEHLALFAHAPRKRRIGRGRVAQVVGIETGLADRFAGGRGLSRLGVGRYGDRCRWCRYIALRGVDDRGRCVGGWCALLLDRLRFDDGQWFGFRRLFKGSRLQEIDDERDFNDRRHDSLGGENQQEDTDVQTDDRTQQAAAGGA